MRKNTVLNVLFSLVVFLTFAACSEKGKDTGSVAAKPISDSTAKAKEDSVELEEGKDVKDALDVVKK